MNARTTLADGMLGACTPPGDRSVRGQGERGTPALPISEAPLRVVLVGMAPAAERPGGGNRYLEDLSHALSLLGARTHTLLLYTQSLERPGVTVGGNPDQAGSVVAGTGLRQGDRQAGGRRRCAQHALRPVRRSCVADPSGALTSLGRKFSGPWAEESAVAGRAGWVAYRAKKAVETFHYRRAEALITLSQEYADTLVKDYGMLPGRVHIITPGVDLEAFRPGSSMEARRQLGLPEDCFIAVAVRRLTARMGLEQLTEAWSADPGDAQLVLAGEGDMREGLDQLISAQSLGERVRLFGRVSDDDLPRLYRAANVPVVPALALEGFGLLVLESLACGTPVIASDTGGMAEALPDQSRDSLVPAGDVNSLAARLRRAVS